MKVPYDVVLPQVNVLGSLRRSRTVSHRISSGSANPENPTSNIGLPITCGTSMRSSIRLKSRPRSS